MKLHPHVLIIGQLPPPIHGVSMMNNYIINSDIINQNFTINVINLQFSKSNDHIRKFSILKIFTAIKYIFEIIKKLQTFKPELVYFTLAPTGYAFYRDAIYVFILKLFQVKILIHLHGKGVKTSSSNNVKKNIYKWVFKNTYIICLSKCLSKDISEVYEMEPIIIPNGIEVKQKFNRTLDQPNNSIPQILYLSNFYQTKGVLELIEALHILKSQGYLFNARFVGAPGNLTVKFLENIIIKKNLAEYIKIIGPLYSNDKFLEFQNADMLVFPTYNEAFGLVLLEAMQFSLPVISTFEGSIPSIVDDNETGFLVEKQNVKMLAKKIAILLKDKNLRIKMGRKGYIKFINNFTLNHFENSMSNTFKTIINSN